MPQSWFSQAKVTFRARSFDVHSSVTSLMNASSFGKGLESRDRVEPECSKEILSKEGTLPS